MLLDPYALFVAVAVSILFITNHFTLLGCKFPIRRIYLFHCVSFVFLFVVSKFLGTLGARVAYGDWIWGPSSILGFLTLEVTVWRIWARKQSQCGDALLRNWSYLGPLTQAVGRLGCYFAGCCFILPGVQAWNWPLLEASLLLIVALLSFSQRNMKPPAWLFDRYLLCTLTFRFVLDFLRGDKIRGTWGIISFPQLICLLLLGTLTLDLVRRKYHNKRA